MNSHKNVRVKGNLQWLRTCASEFVGNAMMLSNFTQVDLFKCVTFCQILLLIEENELMRDLSWTVLECKNNSIIV